MHIEDRIRGLPCWSGSVVFEPLAGGLSNANYLVTDASGKHVVRFGEDYPFHHVSRAHEVMIARAAHAAGLAPAVEHAGPGVMVTAHLEAQTYSAEDVRRNASRIAALLRHFHLDVAPHVSGAASMFWVFHVIRDYVRTLTGHQTTYQPLLGGFLADADALAAVQLPMPIVFGHHDLLPANFLDDGKKLWLIDFEYAGFGTAMFDLAGVGSNAGMDAREELQFLQSYLGHAPDRTFMRSFAAMACASLLRETLWAMVSSLFLAAPGADYEAYARANLNAYRASLDRYQSDYGKLAS
jgi:thiamine kinase-like enzyme